MEVPPFPEASLGVVPFLEVDPFLEVVPFLEAVPFLEEVPSPEDLQNPQAAEPCRALPYKRLCQLLVPNLFTASAIFRTLANILFLSM